MMKVNRGSLRIVFGFLFFLGSTPVFSQETLDAFAEKFRQFRTNNYQEKIYIHTDRSFYVTGDYLWLRVRVVDAVTHKSSDLSKVVYVELVDRDQKPVAQVKVAVNEGTGYTSIYIPASLNSDNYFLRAYTRWMQNYSPDTYFGKVLTIVNTFKPLQKAAPAETEPSVDLQFFPEGGNLVAGMPTRVAFRLVSSTGKPLNRDGVVINQRNDTIARFGTFHAGLGSFEFTPQGGDQYRGVVRDLMGAPVRVELPLVRETGYTLRLEDGDSLLLHIASNVSAASNVHIFAHTRNSIRFTHSVRLRDGKGEVQLSRSLLGDGISHITLFDEEFNPVCERLYFKKPSKVIDFETSFNATRYFKRRKVILDITAEVAARPSENSDLSVSVYRIDSLQHPDGMDILNCFWLTSDLSGTVYEPSFYFSNDKQARQAADLLMMTHGWRRFRWEDVKANEKKKFQPEYRGQIISGVLKNERSPDDLVNIPAYLSIPGHQFHFRGTRSNRQGKIQFEIKDYYGNRKVFVQTDPSRDSLVTISLDDPFSKQFSHIRLPHLDLSAAWADQILRRSVNMQMENAYHVQDRLVQVAPQIDSLAFFGIAEAHYNLDDYTRFSVMEDVLREYVPGVFVRKRKNDFYFRALNTPMNTMFGTDPLVLLDGFPVFNANRIIEYDPLKVKSLDVVTHRFFYGAVTFSGIASFQTYGGDMKDFAPDKHVSTFDYPGLEYPREFFSPVYDVKNDLRTPDFRDLLYWSPRIITDKDGKARITFYTSDQPGKYAVSIQGAQREGTPGAAQYSFTVEEENP